jgi:hypothetical protein
MKIDLEVVMIFTAQEPSRRRRRVLGDLNLNRSPEEASCCRFSKLDLVLIEICGLTGLQGKERSEDL